MTKEEDARKCYNSDIHIATEKGLKEGLELGLEKGIKQNSIEVAKKMIDDQAEDSLIAKYTNLTLAEIEKLKEEI